MYNNKVTTLTMRENGQNRKDHRNPHAFIGEPAVRTKIPSIYKYMFVRPH